MRARPRFIIQVQRGRRGNKKKYRRQRQKFCLFIPGCVGRRSNRNQPIIPGDCRGGEVEGPCMLLMSGSVSMDLHSSLINTLCTAAPGFPRDYSCEARRSSSSSSPPPRDGNRAHGVAFMNMYGGREGNAAWHPCVCVCVELIFLRFFFYSPRPLRTKPRACLFYSRAAELQRVRNKPSSSTPPTHPPRLLSAPPSRPAQQSMGNYLSRSMGRPLSLPLQLSYLYPSRLQLFFFCCLWVFFFLPKPPLPRPANASARIHPTPTPASGRLGSAAPTLDSRQLSSSAAPQPLTGVAFAGLEYVTGVAGLTSNPNPPHAPSKYNDSCMFAQAESSPTPRQQRRRRRRRQGPLTEPRRSAAVLHKPHYSDSPTTTTTTTLFFFLKDVF